VIGAAARLRAAEGASLPGWLKQPLSLADCVDIALRQNSAIVKSQQDVEAAFGIVVQTKAITLPKVRFTGHYTANDPNTIETFPSPFPVDLPFQQWSASIQVVQSIYEGGRIQSAKRTASLTRDQALFQHQTVIADTLLSVRTAYDDALLAAQQIVVQEASVKLLQKELADTTRRFEAGTVPQFNVLRAEVELASARPRLIKGRNAHRNAKTSLANLLGYNLPPQVWEDIPLQLTGKLEAEPHEIALAAALARAFEHRTELQALRKAEALRREAITTAKAGTKPSAQLVAGFGSRNSSFFSDLSREVTGWNAGAQVNWGIFDGHLTKGRVDEATAQLRKAQAELDDTGRRIELEVRVAYSNFIEAKEVLESQKKVQEQAEEALRLANARADAGTGTQLDVLNAQTALTEARTTQVQALHDYSVARARLERAMGESISVQSGQK
jgi:outer membrane protein TolC